MRKPRKQQQHSHQTTSRSRKSPTRSRAIHLEIKPEQLIEKGNLQEAVRLLRTHIRTTPSDEKKRLLGQCFFRLGDFREAAKAWLVIQEKTAHDLSLIGMAYLNLEEWDQAKEHLCASLQMEERGYSYYWLALAQQKNRDDYRLDAEEKVSILDLLLKACVLPACPFEAFLWLDDLMRHGDHDDERTTLLQEAFARYPNVEEVRLRFSYHLLYPLCNYEGALTVVTPLLAVPDPPQKAIACAFRSSQKAGLFEKALALTESMHKSPYHCHGPGLAKVKGDLYLAFGKIDEAISYYEQETQSCDFIAIFIGFFSIAAAWLTQHQMSKAIAAAAQGAHIWFANPNVFQCSDAVFHAPVAIGTDTDWVYIGNESLSACMKDVCEALLAEERGIELSLKGQLSYLLYKYHADHRSDELGDIQTKLLLQAAQWFEHPHISQDLSYHYLSTSDVPLAVKHHLMYCLWQFITLYRSFWHQILFAIDMHQEIVDITALLMKASPDADVDNELWDYAYSSSELGNADEAIHAYRSYLEHCPDHADTLHNLSLLLEEQGLFQEAMALSNRAMALAPDDELIVNGNSRLKREYEEREQARQQQEQFRASSQERTHLWSLLSDSQKCLLCLLELYPVAHWSALLPYVKNDEHQLR